MRTCKSFWGIFFCLIFILSSCVSEKKITYFQPVENTTDPVVTEIMNTYTLRIREGDILSIRVSSLSKEASEMFNPYAGLNAYYNQAPGWVSPQTAVGFLVDKEGNIQLPLVGSLYVVGMTMAEATSKITEELEKSFLKSPTVSVNIANFRVSIMGEVNRPAIYTVPNEVMTLPQAIALAGDLTIYGKRENILIIREENGQRTFARIDLRDRTLFNSEYYYLHPNDYVYVEPKKSKATSTETVYQLTPIILSALTFLLTVARFFVKD